jgi:hypothetical protein
MTAHCRSTLYPLVLLCLLSVASMSSAQPAVTDVLPAAPLTILEPIYLIPESPAITLTAEQLQQVEQWAKDFADWQQWADRWLNRRQPGMWSYLTDRNKKPDPPVWLPDVCDLLGDDEHLAGACRLLPVWRDDPIVARNRQATVAAVTQQEEPKKTSWLQHLHVDGLWSTTQSNMVAFGLFGAHATIDVKGRVQVFAVPGILLMSVPQGLGRRELWPATDWGISYRLFNAGRSTVHFNLVHAWVLANRANALNPNMTLAGFSVSFKPRPH